MQQRIIAHNPAARRSALLALAFLCGCGDAGDERPREPVSGKVSLDGKPLPSGLIQFVPAGEGGDPTHVGTIIKDGGYSIAKEDGPVPGKYRVSITAGAGTDAPQEELPGAGKAPIRDLIPPPYNLRSTLEATVEAGKANRFDYELKSSAR